MYRDNKYVNEKTLTPFMRSMFQIPSWVIVCNAEGPLSEEDLYDE